MAYSARDLSGKRFGLLVAVCKINLPGKKKPYWLCRCDCGGHAASVAADLNAGKSKSCGCTRNKTVSDMSFIDISGQKFGRLVAIDCVGSNSHKKRLWRCVCDCGKFVDVVYSNLKSGTTKSCGCYNLDEIVKRSTKHGLTKLSVKERRDLDPVYAASSRIRTLISNCFRNKGFKKGGSTEEILGCSFEQFKIHIERQFTGNMSWSNRSAWHIDHIVPVSTAKTVEDVKRLNHHTNLRPLLAKENLAKMDSVIFLI